MSTAIELAVPPITSLSHSAEIGLLAESTGKGEWPTVSLRSETETTVGNISAAEG